MLRESAATPFRPIRSRVGYLVLASLTILAGLASRRYGPGLPGWVVAYAGDALWALLVFWLVGLLWPRWPSRGVGSTAWCVAVAVEISQLWHTSWLDALRHTTLGSLVLGQSFLWNDIGCYTVGVLVGCVLERCWLRPRVR
jgi:hypothetical protein